MRLTCLAATFTASVVVANAAMAQERGSTTTTPSPAAQSYPAVPLLSTGTTVIGEPIRYPRTGPAHITAAIVTVEPGGRTIMHKHGVPLFAYILEGELTVNYGKYGTRTYRTGQSLMEAMHAPHYGMNQGAVPVRLLAVYMGAKGAKDVVPAK